MTLLGNIVGYARQAREQRQQAAQQAAPASSILRTLPTDFLTTMIDLQDRIPEKARIGLPGYMHVSSLIGACERQHVIAAHTNTSIVRPVHGADRVVWALGRAAEKHVRTQVLAATGRRGIFGKWGCHCPDESRTYRVGFHDPNQTCPACQQKLDQYFEVTLLDHDNRIAGNPDLVMRHSGLFLPVECKSMEGDAFAQLIAPRGDHIHQALMYRYLLALNGYPVYDKVVIFYVSKRYSFRRRTEGGHPVYKEYHVDATDTAYQRVVEELVAVAALVRDHLVAGTVPPRTACGTSDCQRARDCPVAGTCWNLP